VAAGEPLSIRQEDVVLRGHAIECRINAEDVSRGFLPSPGRITVYREPAGPGVRVDSGVVAGDEISELYDPMIAKLIVHDETRDLSRQRMIRALGELVVVGTPTLRGFHLAMLEHPQFAAGGTCAGVAESDEIAQRASELEQQLSHRTTMMTAAPDGAPRGTRPTTVSVEVDGRAYEVRLETPEAPWAETARRRRARGREAGGHGSGTVRSPMQGTVLAVNVADGDSVESGQVLFVVEAMKMENEVVAATHGVVHNLGVEVGASVGAGDLLCELLAGEDA
jgi:acetyl-CoA/propionyl-CoA carboxylase biotin carboxyl carrier protein